MALCRRLLICNRLHKSNLYLFFHPSLRYTSKSTRRDVYQNDTLDVYTDNLVQEMGNKWNSYIMKVLRVNPKCNVSNDSYLRKEFSTISEKEIRSKIIDFIRENNFSNILFLVKLCYENSYRLEPNFLLFLIQLFAKLGDSEGVQTVILLYKNNNERDFKIKCDLQYFVAQMLWYKGNVDKSFEILESFYRDNVLLRDVNYVLYDIISSAVEKNEMFLILVTNFVQKLVDQYNNYYPISILWKKLYESEYFADNQLAKKLLNNNEKLITVLCPMIPIWSVELIQCHKIDTVQRLCEVLLEYECLDQYSSVLHTLFDYYYYQNNLKRCTAVVKSALDLQIELKESYQKRFLMLLTNGKKVITRSRTLPKRIDYQINLKF